MRIPTKLKLGLFLFLTTVLFIQCSKKDSELSNPEVFMEYLSRFSGPDIGRRDPIDIVLTTQIDVENLSEKELQNLFEISPSVDGKVKLNGSYSVSFVPDELLKSGVDYIIDFQLSKLNPKVPKELAVFRFKVVVPELEARMSLEEISLVGEKSHQASYYLYANDRLTEEEIRKSLKINLDGSPLRYEAYKTNEANRWDIIVENLPRGLKDQELSFEQVGSFFQKLELPKPTTIYGAETFQIMEVKFMNDDSREINVFFSDYLNADQNLDGLIRIDGVKDLKFSIFENRLRISPAEELIGKRTLTISSGILSSMGTKLKTDFSEAHEFSPQSPKIELVKSGNILPYSQDIKYYISVLNLNAADIEILKIPQHNILQYFQMNDLGQGRDLHYVGKIVYTGTLTFPTAAFDNTKQIYALDLSKMIKPEEGAFYHLQLKGKEAFSMLPCHRDNPRTTDNEDHASKDVFYTTRNSSFYEYYWADDYYSDYYTKADPCTESEYWYSVKARTVIFASNLGLVYKKNTDDSSIAIVTNLLTSKPVAGAEVKLHSYTQDVLATAVTDKDGIAKFSGVQKDKPYVAVASLGKDRAYIKLLEGLTLETASFDVDGKVHEHMVDGFIYAERSVWRPGDSIYAHFIFQDQANPLPDKHPIKASLLDPSGVSTQTIVFEKDANNAIYPVYLTTSPNAKTGDWSIHIDAGGVYFTKKIKIETIKPNRLKINSTMQVADMKLDQKTRVNWLTGPAASKLETVVTGRLSKKKPNIKKYGDFNFEHVKARVPSEDLALFNGETNEKGEFSFQYPFEFYQNLISPPILEVQTLTKVFEKSGGFSMHSDQISFSPFQYWIGLKMPESDYGDNKKESDSNLKCVVIDTTGKAQANFSVKIEIYKVNNRWWYDQMDEGDDRYLEDESLQLLQTTNVVTNAEGIATVDLAKDTELFWGELFITASSAKTLHEAGIRSYYYSWRHGNNKKAVATTLRLSKDKEAYRTGETAKISVPTSAGSKVLLSIEDGHRVQHLQWFDATNLQTEIPVKLEKAWGNHVYAHVSVLQPHQQTVNDLPMRMYGVIPIKVEVPEKALLPIISMPDKLRPNEKFDLTIKESAGKEMSYTIAIVDEGLLDLTGFKTPNPKDHFEQKPALGVLTWDVFDQVIGAYGGKIRGSIGIGGDEYIRIKGSKNAMRFEPVVIQLGPFTVGKNGSKKHQIQMPNYMGSVRVMVIAAHTNGAVGAAEKTVPVKQELMVLANAPRKVSPGEKFGLGLSCFVDAPKIKEIAIAITAEGPFKTEKKNTVLSVKGKGEYETSIPIDVISEGASTLKVEISSGSYKAYQTIYLESQNPNPISTQTVSATIPPKETRSIESEPVFENPSYFLSVANGIQLNLEKSLNYLIQYPHGCLEQTTSVVFPQLFLDKLMILSEKQKQKSQKYIQEGIQKITKFQSSWGNFSYWLGESSADDFASTYATHFLIEADQLGYAVPKITLSKAAEWLTSTVNAPQQNKGHLQGYQLYLLAKMGKPAYAAMNLFRTNNNPDAGSMELLAGAYFLAGEKSVGNLLLQRAQSAKGKLPGFSPYGRTAAWDGLRLEIFQLAGMQDRMWTLAKSATARFDKEYLSTQDMALLMVGISKVVNDRAANADARLSYSLIGGTAKEIKLKETITREDISFGKGDKKINLTSYSNNELYVQLVQRGKLKMGTDEIKQQGCKITKKYTLRDGTLADLGKLKQGTQLYVEVSITNTGDVPRKNIAYTEALPSGWEANYLEVRNTNQPYVRNVDVRDDRIHYYFSLEPRQLGVLKIPVVVSYRGKFCIPSSSCEDMYENDFYASIPGQWIEIE